MYNYRPIGIYSAKALADEERVNRKNKDVKVDSITLKQFLIHFRRPVTYDGKYGFDWMRDEYIHPINFVNGISTALCTDINKLKSEYKTEDVKNPLNRYGKDYFCSFITLSKDQEVVLDLEVEALEALVNDATEILFESTNLNLKITPSSIPLSSLISGGMITKNLGGTNNKNYYLASNQIKIKCDGKTFGSDEEIKIFAKLDTLKTEVGKMMVMKNDIKYKLKSRFVKVNFRGKLIKNDISIGTENTLDFSSGTSTASMPSAGISNSISLKLSETISNWKSYIESNETDFKNKFNQALISYEPIKRSSGIDYKNVNINFNNFTVGTSSGGIGIDRIKKSITSIDVNAIACDMEEFLTGLKEVYLASNPEETGIIVFLLPLVVRYSNPPAGTRVDYLDGFSDDIFSTGRYIMLTNFSPLLRKETIVHEGAHTLGLVHSFQTTATDHGRSIVPEHTFEFATTENIMDYSASVSSFWKWQWKKMVQDKTDLETINII